MTPTLKIRRLTPTAVLPAYARPGDAGMDLCADEAQFVYPGGTEKISTGIAIEIPEGHEATVRPRSGLSLKGHTAILGTVDAGYRGEVGVIVANIGREPWRISPGDRIAQLVIAPVARCRIVEVEALSETERGGSGFGSTGVAAIRGVVAHADGSYTMPRAEYERVFGRQTHEAGAGSTRPSDSGAGKGAAGIAAPAASCFAGSYDANGSPEPTAYDLGECQCGSPYHPAHECGGGA